MSVEVVEDLDTIAALLGEADGAVIEIGVTARNGRNRTLSRLPDSRVGQQLTSGDIRLRYPHGRVGRRRVEITEVARE
jgi:hypothetical protein